MKHFARTLACLAVLVPGISGPVAAGTPPKATTLANPASVHCGKLGGRLKIRKDAAGNQTGYCHLPNGSVCEEWALFRDKKCVPPKR